MLIFSLAMELTSRGLTLPFCASSKAEPDAANGFGQEIGINSKAKYP